MEPLRHVSVADGRRLLGATPALAICLLVALGLAACRPPAPEPRDASIAGIVVSREDPTSTTVRLGLASGDTVDIDHSITPRLRGGIPDVGHLLFYGDQPKPWFVGLTPVSEDRFEIWSQPDDAGDGSITFDFGLRLPLASTYDETGAYQLEPGAPVRYVVNGKGEVIDRL